MADGLLGDVAKIAADGVTPILNQALSNEVIEGIAVHMGQAMGGVDSMMHDMQVQLAPDAGLAGLAGSLLHNVDGTANSLEAVSGKIDQIQDGALEKVSSASKDDQSKAQADMEQQKHVIEAAKALLEVEHDIKMHIIENLRVNADAPPDAPLVAMADVPDTHGVVHVDQDAGYNHPVDQPSVAPTHDDHTAPDPSATA